MHFSRIRTTRFSGRLLAGGGVSAQEGGVSVSATPHLQEQND